MLAYEKILSWQNVSGMVERLRERSSIKKPNYMIDMIDESDEDSDIFLSKHRNPQENIVKIERSDTVSCFFPFLC